MYQMYTCSDRHTPEQQNHHRRRHRRRGHEQQQAKTDVGGLGSGGARVEHETARK